MSKTPGDTVRPVSATRSGCATLPRPSPSDAAKSRTTASRSPAVQLASRKREVNLSSIPSDTAAITFAAAASGTNGRLPSKKCAISRICGMVLARVFSSGIACSIWARGRRVQGRLLLRCKKAFDLREQRRVVGGADVLAGQRLELVEVESRRRLAEMAEVEPGDRLRRW